MESRHFLYDSQALRAIEAQAAHASGDGFELMRRAGHAAWHEALAHWPHAQRITVICGPGNNGGDGYVFARHAHTAGRAVCVLRLPGHAPRSDSSLRAEAEYVQAGGRIEAFASDLPEMDLLIDALFGIGLSR
ncbi:MAG: NAD(P)H-hydrate epimerase, partial [Luteimonas sp.]